MKKTLQGKRHIRARANVRAGRNKKTTRKMDRLIRQFSRYYAGVRQNPDGTYTYTWNFVDEHEPS